MALRCGSYAGGKWRRREFTGVSRSRPSGLGSGRGLGLGGSSHDGEPILALEGASQSPDVACRGEGRPKVAGEP